MNAVTYERIKVNVEMHAGERITVTTGYGEKRVEWKRGTDSEPQNAFRHWDPYSKFLQLETGDNLFRYEAGAGENNLLVSVYYTPKYVGV